MITFKKFWTRLPACQVMFTLTVFLVAPALAGDRRDAVVATDGTGKYRSVQEAINDSPQSASATNGWTIYIKPGVYKEIIYLQREKRFIRLVGEDAQKTILTYDLNANLPGKDGKPIGTFRTPTVYIDADDFIAENLTFENSAGPVGQALAVRIDGDRVAFRGCRFLGWQDTILANRGRHYFTNCYISGHVDFIFGGATAFFDRCRIECRGKGYITAASTPEAQKYGFVFSGCELFGTSPEVKTFLGRPWRDFGSVIFLNAKMSEVVRPEGWDNWKKPEREKTARYYEYGSTGPGTDASARVSWARKLSASEAEAITAEKVLRGADGWRPAPK